jgi:predicted DNA-binding transcriptional regulator AlpA
MTHTILLIDELTAILRRSKSSVYRDLSQGNLPKPISKRGGKLRWLASDIEAFLQSQSNANPPVNVPTTKDRKRQAKDYQRRQESTRARLQHHAHNRKVKGGQES